MLLYTQVKTWFQNRRAKWRRSNSNTTIDTSTADECISDDNDLPQQSTIIQKNQNNDFNVINQNRRQESGNGNQYFQYNKDSFESSSSNADDDDFYQTNSPINVL